MQTNRGEETQKKVNIQARNSNKMSNHCYSSQVTHDDSYNTQRNQEKKLKYNKTHYSIYKHEVRMICICVQRKQNSFVACDRLQTYQGKLDV